MNTLTKQYEFTNMNCLKVSIGDLIKQYCSDITYIKCETLQHVFIYLLHVEYTKQGRDDETEEFIKECLTQCIQLKNIEINKTDTDYKKKKKEAITKLIEYFNDDYNSIFFTIQNIIILEQLYKLLEKCIPAIQRLELRLSNIETELKKQNGCCVIA